ncbi:MAG: tRNA lysidine(34) synthetase TilS [Mangrovibacterium sp.]|nr:tRNA lysidine(34) synthetase TilS [Mangrovibacterium sp.]
MINAIRSYIRTENLFQPGDKVILAVSGGVDSMVMLDLFRRMNGDFVVAHCNFHLRGAESDAEEVFLRDYCGESGIELYVKHFDTREYAVLTGVSVEMAARSLRYDWFFELLDQLSFQYVATAHHLDDLIETMLINLSRGTGIRGLSGIQPKNGKIIRPLLFAGRGEILAHAAGHHLRYQDDSSNDELLYQRNVIRHQIIPLFEQMNPAFRKNAVRTASILKETAQIYQQRMDEIRQTVTEQSGPNYRFPIKKLKMLRPLNSMLFELLYPFGFNPQQIKEIANALESEAGKTFFSQTHRIVKDRDHFILTPREEERPSRFYIDENSTAVSQPVSLRFEQLQRDAGFRFSRSPWVADVDYDLLQFPLILKKWEPGEYFQPLGMSGFKKISDFFVDEKMSIPEKESVWILYSGKNVVWITGKRMDDRYKITMRTRRVLRIIMREGEGRL